MSGRILVVDDDTLVLSYIRFALRKLPYDLTLVSSAAAATSLARTHSFDLLITDIYLGGHNGYLLVRTAQAHSPHIGLIFMTAASILDHLEQTKKIGVHIVLQKPLDQERLRSVIDTVLPSAVHVP